MPMSYETAASIIENQHFMPNWAIRPLRSPWLSSSTMRVTITAPVRDSSRAYAPNYPVTLNGQWNLNVELDRINSKADLEDAIMTALVAIWVHEIREFFRDGDLAAPFHPHQYNGNRRWNSILPKVVAEISREAA